MRPTSRSSVRTLQRSARSKPSSSLAVGVANAAPVDRTLALTCLGLTIPWLIYTRFYFFLQPRHLTFDGGFFMTYFHKPDPFCGMTRTFAWMWRGDLLHALSVYPLGPLIFVATLGVIAYSAAVLVSGRALRIAMTRRIMWAVITLGVLALTLNWASKLIWLGM